jgi:hypothetical protein
VNALAISKAPKISKGDKTGHLLFKKIGIELIFKDERFVKIPGKVFPEGAMVLSNVTIYLSEEDGYLPYTGSLPTGIGPNASKEGVLKGFGIPNSPKYSPAGKLLPDEDDWIMRWDRPDHVLFCTFNDEGTVTDMALQLPLDQAA